MFYLRVFFLLLCLVGGGWYLEQERRAGRLVEVDEWFLDFLVANARERLSTPDPDSPPKVALIRLSATDRAEYESWPPSPLDWQMLLKGLTSYQPDLLVIPTPLAWGSPEPSFIPALADAMLPFPSVALGVEVEWSESAQGAYFLGDLADALPRLKITGESLAGVPALKGIVSPPHHALRSQAELGLVAQIESATEPQGWRLPYLLLAGEEPLPTLLAQSLSRQSRTPYSQQRLRLGTGAGAYLSQGRFIPLEADGAFHLPAAVPVPEINALDLMAAALADAVPAEAKATLSQAKVLVLGLDGPDTALDARVHAQALAHILRLPTLRELSRSAQWSLWAAAALGAAWLALATPRQHTLRRGLGLLFSLFVTSLLLFQSSLIWFPPTVPACALFAGTLIGRLFGPSTSPARISAAPSPSQVGTDAVA